MSSTQYTVRNVYPELDRALRAKATREGCSLNAVLIDALKAGAGLAHTSAVNHDFDDLAGTWKSDPACEAALDSMRKSIDPEMWP